MQLCSLQHQSGLSYYIWIRLTFNKQEKMLMASESSRQIMLTMPVTCHSTCRVQRSQLGMHVRVQTASQPNCSCKGH